MFGKTLSKADSPNIVLIVADNQGYGDIETFGNRWLATPNLRRLAEAGISLTQHYSASPICAPARAGLLTGRYNHLTGALSVESNRGLDRIATEIPLIGNFFQRQGYRTSMVGKWHNGLFDPSHHPMRRGFDEFLGFLNGGMGYFDWVLDVNDRGQWRSDGSYLTDVFSSKASEFISRNRSNLFFLYVAYNAPHLPPEAPNSLVQKYRDFSHLDEGVCRIYAMLEAMDSGIGQILDELENHGLYENTLVLFTSDNGPLLGKRAGYNLSRYNGPFRGAKSEVLEGGIRVPAILRWPSKLAKNKVCDRMIHFTDWLPTFLEAAGISSHGFSFDGQSQLSALKHLDVSTPNTQKRFWQYNRYDPTPRCNAAMRDGDWKLYWPAIPEAMKKIDADNEIYKRLMAEPHFYDYVLDNLSVDRIIPHAGKPQLFNLAIDSSESTNLADLEPDKLSTMIHELDNWFDQINAHRMRFANLS